LGTSAACFASGYSGCSPGRGSDPCRARYLSPLPTARGPARLCWRACAPGRGVLRLLGSSALGGQGPGACTEAQKPMSAPGQRGRTPAKGGSERGCRQCSPRRDRPRRQATARRWQRPAMDLAAGPDRHWYEHRCERNADRTSTGSTPGTSHRRSGGSGRILCGAAAVAAGAGPRRL